jgi:hypothetical protein
MANGKWQIANAEGEKAHMAKLRFGGVYRRGAEGAEGERVQGSGFRAQMAERGWEWGRGSV